MKVAIISDIHGNIEALEAVMSHIREQECEDIFCLGDIIGYGPNPIECLKVVSNECSLILSGNHEIASVSRGGSGFNGLAKEVMRYTIKQLRQEDKDVIKRLPYNHHGERFALYHGSPFSVDEHLINYQSAINALSIVKRSVNFFGHTHVAVCYTDAPSEPLGFIDKKVELNPSQKYLINPGSVGQPRDGDSRASYLVWQDSFIEWHRVEYNIKKTQSKMLQAGLPEKLANRLEHGR